MLEPPEDDSESSSHQRWVSTNTCLGHERGEKELNPRLRVWNPLGHHDLHPVKPPTRIELVSLDYETNVLPLN